MRQTSNLLRSANYTYTLLILAIALGSCVASTDEPDDSWPSNVPREYVITPFGYFHPDCTQILDDDETLIDDEIAYIERLDGTKSANIPSCAHPYFDSQGEIVNDDEPDSAKTTASEALDSANELLPPGITKWREDAYSTELGALSYMHAQWNVPRAPKSHGRQTVFFFPGIQSSATILQPVLSWNQAGYAGWSLASWNCCKRGRVNSSRQIPVHGSMVSGDIIGSNCDNGVCSKWQVVSYDWESSRSTRLKTTAYGLKMNLAFGGVLEAYRLRRCSQLPSSAVTFSGFYINRADGTHADTPSWHKEIVPRPGPACDYNISISGDSVTLHY